MSVTEIRWRGPRSLAPGDILRGRDRDLINLVNKARNFDVLEITAPSGVGKSSFIAAGLVPELRLGGSQVHPNREYWSWTAVLTAYDRVAAGEVDEERLYRLCLGWLIEEDDRSLRERFNELRATGRPVVVLDQFEELLRFRERLGAALLKFIGRTAADLGVTHIIAARSEYRDQFRPMEDACNTFFHWALREIDDATAVEAIIEAPVEAAGLTIERRVIEYLRTWWLTARQHSTPDSMGSIVGRTDVGLLHLQGVLWLFRNWLDRHAPATTSITLDHLKEFTEDYAGEIDKADQPVVNIDHESRVGGNVGDARAEWGPDDPRGPRLYRQALVEYVRECCDTIHDGGWSPAHRDGRGGWNNGPRLMMARSAHLFSVLGYKVAQSRSGMLRTVLAEDLEPAIVRTVAEAATRARSEEWMAEIAAEHGAKGIQGKGLAREWSGEQVLHELLAAAVQAWSAVSGDANILRRFVQMDDEVYELVHDGMGVALQEWASEELVEPRSVIGVITPRTGKSISISIGPETFLADQGRVPKHWDGIVTTDRSDETGRVQVNGLGWDASEITSPMHDVTLEGWTLKGARFADSTLRNVVFRRCDLKGAAFENVKMIGVRFEGCNLHGAAARDCPMMSGVEFVHADADGSVTKLSSLDLLSFVGCCATGDGVALRSLRKTIGVVHDGVTGGPWRIDGIGVRHLALHADGEASFHIGDGTYQHVTVEPPDLSVEVDSRARIEHSSIVGLPDPSS